MALMNCPNCGEQISDKAASCPHCGYSFAEKIIIKCEECETEYDADLPVCPKCGCPNPTITSELPIAKKCKSKTVITIVILLLIVGMIGFFLFQNVKKNDYYANMESVSYLMLSGAAEAETAGNLIADVWRNAIFEESDIETDKFTKPYGSFVDDFNDALVNLFVDEDFSDSISEIKSNQTEVTEIMKKLTNPPKDYQAAYSVLKTYYDNYLKLTNLVTNPTGSLQSFTDNFGTYDTETANAYSQMKLYLK